MNKSKKKSNKKPADGLYSINTRFVDKEGKTWEMIQTGDEDNPIDVICVSDNKNKN